MKELRAKYWGWKFASCGYENGWREIEFCPGGNDLGFVYFSIGNCLTMGYVFRTQHNPKAEWFHNENAWYLYVFGLYICWYP